MTKMAGEFGGNVPEALRGVCAVCPSVNLAACADALEWRRNFLYQRHFVRGLLSHYQHKAKLFPELYSQNGFGRVRSVREFDDAITAPQFGYRDSAEYYEAAAAKRVIAHIRVPMLMITAQDDPFVPYPSFLSAGVDKVSAIQFVAPKYGGHCGFISRHPGIERFWAEQRIVDFCEERSNGAAK